jgi:effector-binding domain-containing protein
MKIIKYILLLIVLLSVGGSIFVATQKSDFKIVKFKVINSQKASVFNYINDYRNWENWYAWENDTSETHLIYSNKSSGVGSSYQWTGNGDNVYSTTIFAKENDSIVQKIDFNGANSEITWQFKDTIGGTKVTCISKGEIPFMFKINAFLNGGIEKVIGSKLEKSLVNLDRSLDFELNTFSIKPNGVVIKKGGYYLEQTINCKISKLTHNFRIIIPSLIHFTKQNNIQQNGNPFVLYNSYDIEKGISNVSVCIPIKTRIFTSTGSDIICKELEAYTAYKTSLIGDYSHRDEAWKKATKFVLKNKEIPNKTIPIMEIFTNGFNGEKRPSKWETAIYIATQSNYITKSTADTSTDKNKESFEIEAQ